MRYRFMRISLYCIHTATAEHPYEKSLEGSFSSWPPTTTNCYFINKKNYYIFGLQLLQVSKYRAYILERLTKGSELGKKRQSETRRTEKCGAAIVELKLWTGFTDWSEQRISSPQWCSRLGRVGRVNRRSRARRNNQDADC